VRDEDATYPCVVASGDIFTKNSGCWKLEVLDNPCSPKMNRDQVIPLKPATTLAHFRSLRAGVSPPFFYYPLYIFRQFTFKQHSFAGDGVYESQGLRV